MKSGSSKSKKNRIDVVYSTNPQFNYQFDEDEEIDTPSPSDQRLYVELLRLKGNKLATLITGFVGNDMDLQDLGKTLKTKCGSGGSASDGEILVQGDKVKQVMELLTAEGYQVKRKGG